MKYILKPNEVRIADSTAIIEYKIPSEILMENAARSVAEKIKTIIDDKKSNDKRILILCGSGNNGGDGFAVARQLCDEFDITVMWIGSVDKMTPETFQNYLVLQNLLIKTHKLETEYEINSLDFDYPIIIDALIGVGGSEILRGLVVNIMEKLNSIQTTKIAVDVPTGLNAENGIAHSLCFKADYTITMFAIKTGMLLNQGPEMCGEISVGYLGAPNKIANSLSKVHILEDQDINTLLPIRKRVSSKFDNGKLLVIAGSSSMPGAAALVSNAAIKSGAGLVYLMTPRVHSHLFPEVIPIELAKDGEHINTSEIDRIIEFAQNMDAIAIGPGLGKNLFTSLIVERIIKDIPNRVSIVFDADAITPELLNFPLRENIVLTPHIGEFSKLSSIPRSIVAEQHYLLAKEWAEKLNCTILLKHIPTVISNGDLSYWNIYGNPIMATAGSGDVLTGIIAAFLAQGLDGITSASLGAFIHSKSGDYFLENISHFGFSASNLIDYLPNAIPQQ